MPSPNRSRRTPLQGASEEANENYYDGDSRRIGNDLCGIYDLSSAHAYDHVRFIMMYLC